MKPDSGNLRAGTLRLHYLCWGRGGGIPIIALHGLRAYAQTWQPFAEALSESMGDDVCLYALDQRGRGESDWGAVEDYRTEVYVRDLHALVEHLGIEQFVVVGHSLGGANALEYARQYPDRLLAMVVEDIGPGSSNRGEGAERIRREMRNTPARFDDWEQASAFWKAARPGLSEQGLASRLAYSMHQAEGEIRWKHDQQGIAEARLSITPTDLWPAVTAVRCPTLLVKGGASDFLSLATVEEVCVRNPLFEVVVIEGASHYVHDDQPREFNAQVVRFIRRALI